MKCKIFFAAVGNICIRTWWKVVCFCHNIQKLFLLEVLLYQQATPLTMSLEAMPDMPHVSYFGASKHVDLMVLKWACLSVCCVWIVFQIPLCRPTKGHVWRLVQLHPSKDLTLHLSVKWKENREWTCHALPIQGVVTGYHRYNIKIGNIHSRGK